MRVFVRFDETGEMVPTTAQSWRAAVERLCLSDRVPSAVREVLAEAREIMLMGPWSYPLFTRGMEHALKCAEMAVALRSKAAGVPLLRANGYPTTFAFRLEQLRLMKIITERDEQKWRSLRELRNLTAHPEQQLLITPGAAIDIVGEMVGAIERAFAISGID